MGGGASILSDLKIAWTEELQNEYEQLKRDHEDWNEEQLYDYMKNKYYTGEENKHNEAKLNDDNEFVNPLPVANDEEVVGFLGIQDTGMISAESVPYESPKLKGRKQRHTRPSKSSFLTSSANSNFGGESESGLSLAAGNVQLNCLYLISLTISIY